MREACRVLGVDPGGRFAIQGFGNAGQRAALLHQELLGGGNADRGVRFTGGDLRTRRLNPKELVSYKLSTGSVMGFPGQQRDPAIRSSASTSSILYPAALENAINEKNADTIKAKDRLRAGERPHHPRGGSHPLQEGDPCDSRYSCQRGRRHRVLLRNGAGQLLVLLGRRAVHQRLDQKLTRAYHTSRRR